MSDPVFKENSVLIGGKYGDIQSFTNAQGGNGKFKNKKQRY